VHLDTTGEMSACTGQLWGQESTGLMGLSMARLSFLNRLRGLRRSTLNWPTCVRVTIVRHRRAATYTAPSLYGGTPRSKEADCLPLILVFYGRRVAAFIRHLHRSSVGPACFAAPPPRAFVTARLTSAHGVSFCADCLLAVESGDWRCDFRRVTSPEQQRG
jgi:hypothetical protein